MSSEDSHHLEQAAIQTIESNGICQKIDFSTTSSGI